MSLSERSDASSRPLPVKWLALVVGLMIIVCLSGYLLSPNGRPCETNNDDGPIRFMNLQRPRRRRPN